MRPASERLWQLASHVDAEMRKRGRAAEFQDVFNVVKALAVVMGQGREGWTFQTLMEYVIERERVIRAKEYAMLERAKMREEREREKALRKLARSPRRDPKRAALDKFIREGSET